MCLRPLHDGHDARVLAPQLRPGALDAAVPMNYTILYYNTLH